MQLDALVDRLWPNRPPRVFRSGTARRRFVFHAVVAGILLLVGGLVAFERFEFLFDPDEARAFVSRFGVLAPLVLIAVQALQVVVAPVPGQVLAVVAGYLFGPWWGTLYNVIGVTIGSAAAFWLSRQYGRSYVEGIVDSSLLERFDAIDEDHVLAALFVLFLFPGLPDDVLCFAGGITTVQIRKLVAVAIVGRAPAFFLVNLFGDRLGAGALTEAAVLAFVLLVAAGLGVLYRSRILAAFGGELD